MGKMDNVRDAYDAVAAHYAVEIGEDLSTKIFDRVLVLAFAELARRRSDEPLVADLGCGPGFEAAHLASLGLRVVGIDLSSGMIEEAKRRHPTMDWRVGSFLDLPLEDASLDGATAFYSIIHLAPEDRARAYGEIARVLRPGAPLLVAFHISTAEYAAGDRRHLDEWWGQPVSLDGYFLDPDAVMRGFVEVGFELAARLERGPATPSEMRSQRAYLTFVKRA